MPLPLLDEVFQVVRDWESKNGFSLWPADDLEAKRKFIEFSFNTGNLTLLADEQNRLEGFLFFYRSNQFQGLNVSRPESLGPFVVCDCLWLRDDVRGSGALKRLIKKVIAENKEKILGGEKLCFQNGKINFNDRLYSFPKFYRKFL